MLGRAILVTLLAASFPLEATTVYWAGTSTTDFSVLGSWLTLTGYTLDLKTSAPEDGSDPFLMASAGSFQIFFPLDRRIPGDKLLDMRAGLDPNADLYVGPEFATDREPKLTVQAGAAPNPGTLTIAPSGAFPGENDGLPQAGFGPLTSSTIPENPGDLQAGQNDSPDTLIAANAADR